MADPTMVSTYWEAREADEPLPGAEHHWVLVPCEQPVPAGWGVLGLSQDAQDDFWGLLGGLRARFGFGHWCMGSRSWEDGAVHVVVAQKSPATTVKFTFGVPPAVEPVAVKEASDG